jgi:hypothetical protein
VVVAALAGCNGEGTAASPNPSPSASQSETPSPTASATPASPAPTAPAEASEHTDLGAIAFAKHFVEVLNYTAESGDVRQLRRVSTAACESCRNIIRTTQDVYAAGGYVRGGEWSVETQSVFRPSNQSGGRIVTFDIGATRQVFRPAADQPEMHYLPQANVIDIFLRPTVASWVVTRMDKTS